MSQNSRIVSQPRLSWLTIKWSLLLCLGVGVLEDGTILKKDLTNQTIMIEFLLKVVKENDKADTALSS